MHEDQERSNAAVKHAFDRGLNYFDVAPAYGRDGECEIKLGLALQQLQRKDYVLSSKTKARDKEGARAELERSLERLKTDHLDLYQLHHLVTPDDTKRAFGPGGAIETLVEARKEGKVKWLGFSAHSTRAAVNAMRAFDFDTVMFPISSPNISSATSVAKSSTSPPNAAQPSSPSNPSAWAHGPRTSNAPANWWYRTTETPEEISLALRSHSLSRRGHRHPPFIRRSRRQIHHRRQRLPDRHRRRS
jgi:hypothetical protein